MAVLHKKRNANTKKRARLMLGMAACVFAPTALAVWYLTALLAKRQPPAALAYGALAAAAAGALCFRVLYHRSAVLKSGIDGERQAAAARARAVRLPCVGEPGVPRAGQGDGAGCGGRGQKRRVYRRDKKPRRRHHR